MSKGSCLSFTKMGRHLKRLSKAWFVLAVLVWLNIWVERETPGDVSFPMVNRNIVWMGAGYNGINAH